MKRFRDKVAQKFTQFDLRIKRNKNKQCGLKQQYSTKKHAESIRRCMEVLTSDFFDKYKCKLCHYYHIGHTPDSMLNKEQKLQRERLKEVKQAQLELLIRLIKEQS